MDKKLSHGWDVNVILEKPSFSSTLLDAIYRSIDEDGNDTPIIENLGLRARESYVPCSVASRNPVTIVPPEKRKVEAVSGKAVFIHRTFTSMTSSSSESSCYSGFSSSDTDAVHRPIRTGMLIPAARSGAPPENRKSKSGSIRRKLRELRTRTPVSPGARVASFLNSFFTPSTKKTPNSDLSVPRSCMSMSGSLRERSPPSDGLKRSVRFDPVSVKCLDNGGGLTTGARDRRIKDTVEELLLRRFEEEEVDEEDCGSDSSSDLFELENLNGGSGGGGGYCDELPVFETTHLKVNRAPSLRF